MFLPHSTSNTAPPHGEAADQHATTPLDERPAKRLRATSDANAASSRPAARRKTACQSCRVRKVKCDAARPRCALCQISDQQCEYLDETEKLTIEKSTEILCKRLDALQKTVDRLRNAHAFAVPQDQFDKHPLYLSERHNNAAPSADAAAGASRDFLAIPAHKSSADVVLTWEIFEGRYPAHSLISALFTPQSPDESDVFAVPGGLKVPDEEHVPQLVDSFLQNVHTKNPILDVESLVKHARRIGINGFGWDGWSCLVLLACALGAVASRFDGLASNTPVTEVTELALMPSGDRRREGLPLGESCFVLASRRLGGLKHTILGAQCYFFAGVYLMYTLRPLLSWQYFSHASALYQLYVKTTYGLSAEEGSIAESIERMSSVVSVKQRRLEQSLYWSCFKSESEFRVELPLPQSEIASYHHPHLFPSPPSPCGGEQDTTRTPAESAASPDFPAAGMHTTDELDLRAHAKRLGNEEESWYYYLTEIALRRIGNRVVNTFFRSPPCTWLNVQPFLSMAFEFDTQLSSWSAHLPPAMQHWETMDTIRAPMINNFAGQERGQHVSRELSWAIDNRLLEVRSWLCQPFLYYLIHHSSREQVIDADTSPINAPRTNSFDSVTAGLNPDDAAILRRMITSGIQCNMAILSRRSLRHRHHGLWFDLRALACSCFIMLAVIKSGNGWMIPGGVDALWGVNSLSDEVVTVEGAIGRALEEMDYWSVEASEMRRHAELVNEIATNVKLRWVSQVAGP